MLNSSIRTVSSSTAAALSIPIRRTINTTTTTTKLIRNQFSTNTNTRQSVHPAVASVQAGIDEELRQAALIKRKNAILGISLGLFVFGIYYYSIRAVRSSADTLSGSEITAITAELDKEEADKKMKLAAAKAK